MEQYSQNEICEALEYIDKQLEDDYLDISNWPDRVELDIVRVAIELFKEKYLEKEND